MTPEEQRIAIAEFCGWVRVNTGPVNIKIWTNKDCPACSSGEVHSHTIEELPNYLSDLNAMHEAEKFLSEKRIIEYNDWLKIIIQRDSGKYAYDLDKGESQLNIAVYKFVWHATAPQRAEALLRTINKWKD